MLDFPIHFPGTNATLPWAKTEMSAAVVLVALTVVVIACCGAAALVMVTCCGGRRRDTVGESGDSRWLPGVGVIDYVPTSNRSSIRVSLVLSEDEDGPSEGPNTVSTNLIENASNSSISLISDAETNLPPTTSSSTATLPALFEEVETESSTFISQNISDISNRHSGTIKEELDELSKGTVKTDNNRSSKMTANDLDPAIPMLSSNFCSTDLSIVQKHFKSNRNEAKDKQQPMPNKQKKDNLKFVNLKAFHENPPLYTQANSVVDKSSINSQGEQKSPVLKCELPVLLLYSSTCHIQRREVE